jgi:anti-sigma-K factor RskA
MTHDEAYELLAALSLDAVDADERAAIEEHVAQCPRCQSELDALREVASAMGNSVEALPDGLWSSISTRIYEVDGEQPRPPLLLMGGLGEPSELERRRQSSSARRTRTAISTFGALAAAVIVVLAFSLAGANNHVSQLQGALGKGTNSAVEAALLTPDHKLVNLVSSTKVNLAQFVVLPDGQGYLVKSAMPTLSPTETYQLWGVINGKTISIGLMGGNPHEVAFTVSGTSRPSKLAVTIEPAGGSVSPTTPVVATGIV